MTPLGRPRHDSRPRALRRGRLRAAAPTMPTGADLHAIRADASSFRYAALLDHLIRWSRGERGQHLDGAGLNGGAAWHGAGALAAAGHHVMIIGDLAARLFYSGSFLGQRHASPERWLLDIRST